MPIGISSSASLPDFLGIRWGASREEARTTMLQREGVVLDEQKSGRQNLVFTGGLFANKDVQMWVLQFADNGLHTAKILIAPPPSILEREFQDLIARLTREYDDPVQQSQPNKKLYTFGSRGEVEGSILCQVVPEGQILTTYQHQKLNKKAMSEMTGLDAPIEGMPSSTQPRTTGGGCFIATATMGHCDHPTVVLLRQYRDDSLQQTPVGRAMVRAYYAASPVLARLIDGSPVLRRLSYYLVVRPASFIARGVLGSD